MRTFNIVCGGSPSVADTAEERTIHMDVQGDFRNVNLKITDISKAMVSNIPDVLMDLLELAAYVYCADQRCPRGSDMLPDYGSHWRRDMRFTIPMRLPDLWETPAMKDALRETLGFLSDDTYSFSFVKAEKPLAEKELYFSGFIEGTFAPDEIALFSGGVDSFAGAVEDLVINRKNMAFVGHFSAGKVVSVQKELIKGLKKKGFGKKIFYTPINVTNTGGTRPVDHTQRTRSFLFACLGLVIARLFEKDSITFYENGVISLNIPIAKDVLGARATRTTHPKVLHGFETIFSELLNCEIKIRTPLQWLTKREVVEKLGSCNFADLLRDTVSCTRTLARKTLHPHCGTCSQCIDRRFATLAASMENFDPEGGYIVDLLTGERGEDRDIRMAIAYVKCFQKIAACPKNRFLADYPEITSALRYYQDITTDEAKDRIYDLCQRHAQDVLTVLADGTRLHMDELVRGELPVGSILSMCFNRSRIEISPPSGYDSQLNEFMDRLSAPKFEFAVDEESKQIVFKGDFALTGADYKLVEALLPNFRDGKSGQQEIACFGTFDLAEKLGIEEPHLRKQIDRLRKKVNDRLSVDLGLVLGTDDFIENKQRKGYRLNSNLREMKSVGDL